MYILAYKKFKSISGLTCMINHYCDNVDFQRIMYLKELLNEDCASGCNLVANVYFRIYTFVSEYDAISEHNRKIITTEMHEQIIKLYTKSHLLGHTLSMFSLAQFYKHIGKEELMLRSYKYAVRDNQCHLSMMALSKLYSKRDPRRSYEFFIKSKCTNSTDTHYNFAVYNYKIAKKYNVAYDEFKYYYGTCENINNIIEDEYYKYFLLLSYRQLHTETNKTNAECIICFDVHDNVVNLKCGGVHNHCYCSGCFDTWFIEKFKGDPKVLVCAVCKTDMYNKQFN